MRFIDARCQPTFCSKGDLSFEIYTKISATASGIGTAFGTTMGEEGYHSPISLAPHKSLKEYISFFDKEVRPCLLGSDFSSHLEVDSILLTLFRQSDFPTTFFSSTSIAVAKAISSHEGLPLYSYLQTLSPPRSRKTPPTPIFNILDATNSIYRSLHTIPFLLILSGNLDIMETLIMGSRVLAKAREICWEDKRNSNIAPQGGVLTSLNNCEEGFNIVIKAASRCGYHVDEDFTLGIDFEAEYFKTPEGAMLPWLKEPLSVEVQISHWLQCVEEFPLSYIEDPFLNDEAESWRTFIRSISPSIMLVGDKFFSSSLIRDTRLEESNPINSFILKPNFLPTVTEVLNTINRGLGFGWIPIVSHRTIDSDDTFLSHLAIAS